MKINVIYKLILILSLWTLIACQIIYSQEINTQTNERYIQTKFEEVDLSDFNYIPKKPGHYSAEDWQAVIDSTWGEGLPTAQKLAIFDEAWNILNANYAAFQGLAIDWDSIRTFYRPEVAVGVSRGRFAAIMNYMSLALQEYHTIIWDTPVMRTPLAPGVPLLYLGGNAENTSHFGATLTPLPDSTSLVVKAVSNHPIGLQPGDIIVGYDGIPWKELVYELLSAQLPIYASEMIPAGDKIGFTHNILCGAGMNWHLFDTLDVIKYTTGDTMHFPTALLAGQNEFIWGNEQLTISGVEWVFDGSFNALDPEDFGDYISYGIITGTNVGYIYAVAWSDYLPGNISGQFYDAVYDLMQVQNVDGLIIDQRLNYGGRWQYQYGASLLFNSIFRLSGFDKRGPDPNNHYQMVPETQWDYYLTTYGSGATFFDRPIAVLIGPAAGSSGDMFPGVMRTHPMARLFGKPTNGSFSAHYGGLTLGGNNDWTMYYTGANGYLLNDPGNYLSHRATIPDEEVWFTPDGVANGQDDVVNRALDWINNLVYPHNTITDKLTYSSNGDTVNLSTIIENPNSHLLLARIYIHNLNDVFIDSVELTKQTLNTEDENWAGNLILPTSEEYYKVSVTVFDQTTATSFKVPNATRFTTTGPVVLDSISCTKSFIPRIYTVIPFVINLSDTSTIKNVRMNLICDDPWIESIQPSYVNLIDLPPGEMIRPVIPFNVRYIDSLFTGEFNFRFEIMSDLWPYWTYSTQVYTSIDEKIPAQLTYILEQNYPNPFNPSTKIQFQIPSNEYVTLKIYNLLGEEVATLLSDQLLSGIHSIEWNASDLASGVYIYQLKMGKYQAVKKMLLLK